MPHGSILQSPIAENNYAVHTVRPPCKTSVTGSEGTGPQKCIPPLRMLAGLKWRRTESTTGREERNLPILNDPELLARLLVLAVANRNDRMVDNL